MHEFVKFASNDVLDDLEADKELKEVDREDFAASVTFVQHTKPESAGAVTDEGKNGEAQTASVSATTDTAPLDDANVDLDSDGTTNTPQSYPPRLSLKYEKAT